MKKLMRNVKFFTFFSAIVLLFVCGGARPSQAQGLAETPAGILKAMSVLASHAGVSVTFTQVADPSTNLSLKGDVDLAGSSHMVIAPTTSGSFTVQNQNGTTYDVVADSATNIACPQIIP